MTLRTKSEVIYLAASIEEVAEYFLKRAQTFGTRSSTKSRYQEEGKRRAWKEAAQILLSLQIVSEDELYQYEEVDPAAMLEIA